MTKIKLCGLSRPCDVEAANALKPDYIGFVFAPQSKRYVTPRQAAALKELLSPDIAAVGVFADEAPEVVAGRVNRGGRGIARVHGGGTEGGGAGDVEGWKPRARRPKCAATVCRVSSSDRASS